MCNHFSSLIILFFIFCIGEPLVFAALDILGLITKVYTL